MFRRESVFLCHACCAESANILLDPANGDVGLLSEGGVEKPDRADGDFQRSFALSRVRAFRDVLAVSVPWYCAVVAGLSVWTRHVALAIAIK